MGQGLETWECDSQNLPYIPPAVYGISTDTDRMRDTHSFVFVHHHHHHHHYQSLNREGRWGTTMTLQPVFSSFPRSPLPSGTYRTPGLSIP